MNQYQRSKVVKYLCEDFYVNNVDEISELSFAKMTYLGWENIDAPNLKYGDLAYKIRRCMELTNQYYSREPGQLNKKDYGSYQCTPGRYRSVVDIWRHLKKYNPNLEIYDVMHTMYLMTDELSYQFCCTVDRRVFWLFEPDECNCGEDEYCDCEKEPYHSDEEDEFELEFYDWRNI